jgi:hypothetical protein
MRTTVAGGTLILLALTACFSLEIPGQPQAPAAQRAGTASQDQARPSAADKSSQSAASAGKRKIPCKTPENASLCYWTHGRFERYLSFDGENGEDARWHLWKIGTRRVVRVCNGPSHFPPHRSDDCTVPEFPQNLGRVYKNPHNWEPSFIDETRLSPLTIFADFEICPLEPARNGKMQAVCMESAKNIFVDREN